MSWRLVAAKPRSANSRVACSRICASTRSRRALGRPSGALLTSAAALLRVVGHSRAQRNHAARACPGHRPGHARPSVPSDGGGCRREEPVELEHVVLVRGRDDAGVHGRPAAGAAELPEHDLVVDVVARDPRSPAGRLSTTDRRTGPAGAARRPRASPSTRPQWAHPTHGVPVELRLDEVVVEPSRAGEVDGLRRPLDRRAPACAARRGARWRRSRVASSSTSPSASTTPYTLVGTRLGDLVLAQVGGDGRRVAQERVAVAAAALPVHVEHLAGGHVALGVAGAVAPARRRPPPASSACCPRAMHVRRCRRAAGEDLEAGVAGVAAGQTVVLRRPPCRPRRAPGPSGRWCRTG